MSIEFSPAFDSGRSSLAVLHAPTPGQSAAPPRLPPQNSPPKTSPRRVAANRRNAQRSTGPRTPAGKRRASHNAIKHGLCSTRACLGGECPATYATFVREIEAELQPRTALQHALIPHIANLMWRIDRLPQAQADMFEQELNKCAEGETLSASQILARRFSDDPRNGFLLMGRYERGLQNQLLRLMSRYEWLKKHRPTAPLDEDDRRAAARERGRRVDAYVAECARHMNASAAADEARRAERTQSNPPQNRDGASETAKCAENGDAPVTKRTQRDDPNNPDDVG